MMTWILTVLLAGEVARCESGHDWQDAKGVLTVLVNRARDKQVPLASVVRPGVFAFGCPVHPRTPHWRHLLLGARAVTGTLEAPGWLRAARFFCSPHARPGRCHERRLGLVGQLTHSYYRASL